MANSPRRFLRTVQDALKRHGLKRVFLAHNSGNAEELQRVRDVLHPVELVCDDIAPWSFAGINVVETQLCSFVEQAVAIHAAHWVADATQSSWSRWVTEERGLMGLSPNASSTCCLPETIVEFSLPVNGTNISLTEIDQRGGIPFVMTFEIVPTDGVLPRMYYTEHVREVWAEVEYDDLGYLTRTNADGSVSGGLGTVLQLDDGWPLGPGWIELQVLTEKAEIEYLVHIDFVIVDYLPDTPPPP